MIGQEKNLETIKQWKENNSTPRFIIIQGDKGSGRLTLSKEIMNSLGAQGVIISTKISDIRETIEMSYTNTSKTVYIFTNCDDMSLSAKNSLLKIFEEPPKNSYFIMTVHSLSNVLDTIKSRGVVLKMQPYSKEQLKHFSKNEKMLKYLSTPGLLQEISDKELNVCEKVALETIDELNKKHGVGILSCTNMLRAKDTEKDKIDPMLFFNIFNVLLLEQQVALHYSSIKVLEECKQQLNNKATNEKMAIETALIKLLATVKK